MDFELSRFGSTNVRTYVPDHGGDGRGNNGRESCIPTYVHTYVRTNHAYLRTYICTNTPASRILVGLKSNRWASATIGLQVKLAVLLKCRVQFTASHFFQPKRLTWRYAPHAIIALKINGFYFTHFGIFRGSYLKNYVIFQLCFNTFI